jgi:hypothetical protein
MLLIFIDIKNPPTLDPVASMILFKVISDI